MPSSDPWFDWWIDYGNLDGFNPIPPEFDSVINPNGTDVNGWQRDDGTVAPVIDPFPPLPPNAPQCAKDWYQSFTEVLGLGWLSARANCGTCSLRMSFYPNPNFQSPPDIYPTIACQDITQVNWNDPCWSDILGLPSDCDYLLDWFSGYFRQNCPDRELTRAFSPAVHRLVSEIVRPTGRAFLWRLAYDQPVFWPLVFNPEVLTENNVCKSWALGILLQVEAMQDVLNQVQTPTAYVQFSEYFDGILLGRKYVVTDENGLVVAEGLIGYNPNLELGFCLGEKIFREDIGRVACENGEDDDMGCSCQEIRQIVQEELARIRDEYLEPTYDNTRYIRNLFEPIESMISDFFGADNDNAWTRFLSRFSFLSGFLRPSETDEDSVITPPLPDRIEDAFKRAKARERAIFSNVAGLVRVLVRFSNITGERISSRDTHIPPTSARPYNHFGQVWLEYGVGNTVRLSAWQWIRSRQSEHLFFIPDLRNSPTEQLEVSAKYQLFAGLTTGAPEVQVFLPELLTADYWLES